MPSSAWLAATASLTKAPVSIVRFDGLASVQYSSGYVKSPSRTTKQLLVGVSSISQKSDPVTGSVSVNRVTVELTDLGDEILDIVATEQPSPTLATLANRKVTILYGYADIAEADYESFSAFIISVEQGASGLTWIFTLGDPKKQTVMEIFSNAQAGSTKISATLNSAASAGEGLLDLFGGAQGFTDDDSGFVRNAAGQEERFDVAQVKGNGNLVLKEALAFSYAAGDEIRWASTVVEGNPINILWSVLTGTFSLTGSFPLTKIRGIPTGLGVATADIDEAALQTERDHWLRNVECFFEVDRPVRANKWLEEEIYQFFGYPIMSASGKFSFRAFRPRMPSEEVFSLTESDILIPPAVPKMERLLDDQVNRVVVGLDWDIERDKFLSEIVIEDTANQASVGTRERKVTSTGLRSSPGEVGINRFATAWARRQLLRWLHGAPKITLRTNLTQRRVNLGMIVDVTHSKIPNLRAGTRGLAPTVREPGYWEVTAVTQALDPTLGEIEMTLIGNHWRTPAFIAPSGQADYGSASSAEKEYAYISPAAGANFSNGDPPYRVI